MKTPLNILILFKNRDLQTKALLESLYFFMQSYYPIHIKILYDDVSSISHMHRGATLQFKYEFSHLSFEKVVYDDTFEVEKYFIQDEYNLVLPDNTIFTLPFDLKHLYELDSHDVLDLFKGLNRQKQSVNQREEFLFGVYNWNRHVDDYLYHIQNGQVYFETVPDVSPMKYYGKIFIPNNTPTDILERKHYFYPLSPCFINAINTVNTTIDFYDVDTTNMNNAYGLALKYLCGEKIDVEKLHGVSTNSLIYQHNFSYLTKFQTPTFRGMFPNVCYINLPSRTDRKEKIESEIKKIDVPNILRFSGTEISDEEAKDILSVKHSAFIQDNFLQSKKRLGCMLSHLNVVKYAKEQQWKSVLILEDDCVFLPNAQEILGEAVKELKYLPKWDMLYLGANALAPIEQISPHIGKMTGGYCAHAYIVADHFYDTILNVPRDQYVIIDQWYMDVMRDARHTVYTVLPIVAVQGGSYSDIEMKNVSYENVLTDSYKQNLNRNL